MRLPEPTGPIDAVLFDLYGTLVPEYSTADFYASVAAMGYRRPSRRRWA